MNQGGMNDEGAGQSTGAASTAPAMPEGVASGKRQGLREPADDGRVADAVDHIGLSDRGKSMEDHLRDRRSKGVRNGFDDSIGHDAASQFVEPDAIDPTPPRR
jgi:hypothetical protein